MAENQLDNIKHYHKRTGRVQDTTCECGNPDEEQTVEHVLLRCGMTREARRKGEEMTIETLLYTDVGIPKTLAIWAAFEKGRKEARLEEGEIEERRNRELDWGRGDLE